MISNNRKIEVVGLTLNGVHAERAADEIKIILSLVKEQMDVADVPNEYKRLTSLIVDDVTQKLRDDIRFYGMMSDAAHELMMACSEEEGFDVEDVIKWSKELADGTLTWQKDDEKPVRVVVE